MGKEFVRNTEGVRSERDGQVEEILEGVAMTRNTK